MDRERIELAEKAKELQDAGFSMSEIATELGISKTTVHRLIHEAVDETVNGTRHNVNGIGVDVRGNELTFRIRQLELDHERKMYELRNRARELDLKFDKKEDKKKGIIRKGKLYLNRYRRLLNELLENSEDSEWTEEDVEGFVDRLVELRDEMEDFIALKTDYAPSELTIWHRLNEYIGEFEGYLDDMEDTITIDYDKKEAKYLDECLGQDDFFLTEDDDEDSEEDEDDD